MATLDVPNRYLAIAPLIVTSPTSRCGTTLLQRLLSSSGNAFVYGEEVGCQVRALTAWLVGLLQQLERNRAADDACFGRAIAGDLTDWRPGLSPPSEIMLRAWIETYYQLPASVDRFSSSIGRPIWGFKMPGCTRDVLRSMFSMMPRARVIYVFRNLVDVLRSAKARKFVETDAQIVQLCIEWATNMRETAELSQDQRIMFVEYEELIAHRSAHLRLLETFTGARGVDPQTFDVKVNTFAGDPELGYSPTQYIEPAGLTGADRAAVLGEAGPVMDHFYPGWAERSGRVGGELQASQARV